MRLKSRLLNAVAGIAGAALIASSLSGCAYLQKPRSWGTCAIVGGLLGAGVGAASGIVIVDNSQGNSSSNHDARAYAGVGGAVIGAGLGALAGHYICDPVIPPPPPPPPSRCGRASLTTRARPRNSRPFRAAMTFSASASSRISANPKPRGWPVNRSRSSVRESGCTPASANSAATSSSVALNERLPTYSFFTVHLPVPPPLCGWHALRGWKKQDRGRGQSAMGRPLGLKQALQQLREASCCKLTFQSTVWNWGRAGGTGCRAAGRRKRG